MSNSTIDDLRRILGSPSDFARMLTIMDKSARTRQFVHNRSQTHFFQNYSYGTRRTDIVLKARQQGFTTGIVGEIFRQVMTGTTRAISLIDTDKNTSNIREMVDRFYSNFPEAINISGQIIRRVERYVANDTLSRFDNSSRWVIGTAGAKTSGVGSTLDVFHLSEMARFADAKSILVGAGQAAEFARWKVWESTAFGAIAGQPFYERALAALDGDPDYKLHFYPWWWTDEYQLPLEHGEELVYTDEKLKDIQKYSEQELVEKFGLTPQQIKWRRSKIKDLGPEFFQEYPEDPETAFLTSGFGYFGSVSGFFGAPLPAVFDSTHTYVAGIDFSQLTSNDFLAMMIGDATARKHVDTFRTNSGTFKQARGEIRKKIKEWNIRHIRAEKNSARGEIEALRDECAEDGLDVAIWGYDMTPVGKPKLMHSYRAALQEAELELQDNPIVRAELRAAKGKDTTKGWTVESHRDENGHGDTVVAGALMWKAMNEL